jgi:hypothetical protein
LCTCCRGKWRSKKHLESMVSASDAIAAPTTYSGLQCAKRRRFDPSRSRSANQIRWAVLLRPERPKFPLISLMFLLRRIRSTHPIALKRRRRTHFSPRPLYHRPVVRHLIPQLPQGFWSTSFRIRLPQLDDLLNKRALLANWPGFPNEPEEERVVRRQLADDLDQQILRAEAAISQTRGVVKASKF